MKKYLSLLFCIAVMLVACKKDAPKLTVPQRHDVSSVAGPSTGNVNTDIILTVTYPYINGCDYIGSFAESNKGNPRSIQAYSKSNAKDAVCTQETGFRTIEYKFRSENAGTYELRFLKLDNTYITHTITIQ